MANNLKKLAKQIRSFSGVSFKRSGDVFVFEISDEITYHLEDFGDEVIVLTLNKPNPYYPGSCDAKTQRLQISGFKPQDRTRVFMETVRKAAIEERDLVTLDKLAKKYEKRVGRTEEAIDGVKDDRACAEIIEEIWGDSALKVFEIHSKLFINLSNHDFYTTCICSPDWHRSFLTSIDDFVHILTDSSRTTNKEVAKMQAWDKTFSEANNCSRD